MSKEYVIVPKEDYVDTCNAIREKINNTKLIKSGEMAQAVRDIQSGDDSLLVGIIQRTLTEIIVPKSVTCIGEYAFAFFWNLKSIVLNDGITKISHNAFRSTRITDINIPDSVTYLGDASFMDCTSLKTVTIGKGITQIPIQCFFRCPALTSIVIPSNVTKLIEQCFRSSGLTTVFIPNSIKFIGLNSPFGECSNLEFVTIEEGFNCHGLNLASSTKYTRETIVSWFNALADRTGLETYTLTIGATNLAKLTEEDIAIATNKNWTVA